ncbi:MAG: sigma-54 dependent transcriptional regulator [Bdellovibrionota bacterium]
MAIAIDTKKNQTIVVVDDDLDIQDLISAYFKPKGFQVICFSDAESALKESLSAGNKWDVLLADLNLPLMSGIEFTVAIKKLLPNLPIVLITTSKSAEIAIEAIQKGAYDFIVKPIHFPQLQVSVERALHINHLNQDIGELRERVKLSGRVQNKIIGRSPRFVETLEIAKRVAKSTANILITGESGTGKEVFAKFIHEESNCAKGPFVAINCSAIPENLLESELFGHAKGAFTGAYDKKMGLFEEAQDGTLFLDEIGDLSLSLQAKLLRVLQERKIKRVGENQQRAINCRIISATHKELSTEIREGRFREDLYFRLNVIPITIPPLRERQEDLILLAESFLRKFSLENSSLARTFSKETLKFILENPWRGNVRELENTIERAVVLSTESEICLDNLLPFSRDLWPHAEEKTENQKQNTFTLCYEKQLPELDEVITKYIEFAVQKNGGARDKTAKEIGIDRKTLYKRLLPTSPSPEI